ncbi:MAG: hypothetical protein Q8K32_10985 [Archangium sp.]|nr:hypothetical protein [Archangium sp.]
MNPSLRAMLTSALVVGFGGTVGFLLYAPQPQERTMLELRDAGIADGQPLTLICPERLTKRTANRINRVQPGVLRPQQAYARVARSARCFNPDGGNCFRPSDGLLRVGDLEGSIVVPSLRRDAVDGGEDEVDDSLQFKLNACSFLTCQQTDIATDAGTFVNPYAAPFCGPLNRVAVQPLPYMLPDCFLSDGGGWDNEMGEPGHDPAPDCKWTGIYAQSDGGPRWRGCSFGPRELAVGSGCLPVESSILSGDPMEWL